MVGVALICSVAGVNVVSEGPQLIASKLRALIAARRLTPGQFGATVASPWMQVVVNQSIDQALRIVTSLPVGSAKASLLLAKRWWRRLLRLSSCR